LVLASSGIAVHSASAADDHLAALNRDQAMLPARYQHLGAQRSTLPPPQPAVNLFAPCDSVGPSGWAQAWASDVTGSDWFNAVDGTGSTDVWAVGAVQDVTTGLTSTLIQHYDGIGSVWLVVPTPSLPGNSELYTVTAVSPVDAWAGGYDQPTPTSERQPLLMNWNGSTWNVVSVPSIGYASNRILAIDADSLGDVYAVGYFHIGDDNSARSPAIWRWDGTSAIPDVIGSYIGDTLPMGVAIGPTRGVIVGGYSLNAVGSGGPYPAEPFTWTGTFPGPWTIALGNQTWANAQVIFGMSRRTPAGPLATPYAVGGKAVGLYDVPSAWTSDLSHPLDLPTLSWHNNDLYGLAIRSPTDVWAVGAYLPDWSPAAYTGLMEHFNGASWSAVAWPDGILSGAAAISPTGVWSVGYEQPTSTTFRAAINQFCGPEPSGFTMMIANSVGTGTTAGLTITALEQWSQPWPGYLGTVYFDSTDPTAILPPPYQFTPADQGTHTFPIEFGTIGFQTVDVWDADYRTNESVSFNVVRGGAVSSGPPAPVPSRSPTTSPAVSPSPRSLPQSSPSTAGLAATQAAASMAAQPGSAASPRHRSPGAASRLRFTF
jgi:hypothetical protein